MWQCRIEMPLEVNVSGEWIDTGVTYEVILNCEPDESIGDTNYWISGVGIEGRLINDMMESRPRAEHESTHWLPRTHPLHQAAIAYAKRDWKIKERLNDLWAEWLYDRPSRRADARAY